MGTWLIPGLVFALTVGFGIGIYQESYLSKRLDIFFYDTFVMASGSGSFRALPLSDRITIVDIDEASLSGLGQWPWPRYRVAQLVERISELKPAIIGIDILFPEPDRTSLKSIQTQFRTDFGMELDFSHVPVSLADNDAYLAYVFRQSPIVGARHFGFDYYNRDRPCFYQPFEIIDKTGKLRLHSVNGILCNTEAIENSLQVTGFTNIQNDVDGLIRKAPLLMAYKDQIFTHFAFSTFLKLQGLAGAEVLKDGLGMYVKAGRFRIPIDGKGHVAVRFPGPAKQFRYISALDVFKEAVLAGDIVGKTVLIGSSAVGLNDAHHTLYDPVFPGIEINAVMLDNMMNNRLVITPDWGRHLVFILCCLTGLVMFLPVFRWYSARRFILVALVWGCLIPLFSSLMFLSRNVFVSPGHPMVLTLIYFSVFSFIRFYQTQQASLAWIKELSSSQQFTMEAMVSLVETRDPETGDHIARTQHYGRQVALYLQKTGQFSRILSDEYIELLFLSIPLHDIGKVGIPDRILMKPGKLSEPEFELMKLHTVYGRDTIDRAAKKIKGNNYLKLGAEIAGSHHEYWDGTGYPKGLSGDKIPLSARIMTIVDVYDALISKRCYKPPFSHEEAMALIRKGNGTQFDPAIVRAFIEVEAEIQAIASRFKDEAHRPSQG